MNNEEKAKEIANKCKTVTEKAIKDGYNGELIWIKESDYDDCYKSALKMAQWKDEQLDFVIDKVLQRNGDFLKQGKITQYGYDMAFATIKNIREYLKQ